MVRRCRGRLADVADLDRLARAFHRAARGKRHRPEVLAFADRLDDALPELAAGIEGGTAPTNRYRRFAIRDPKPRVIHAPVFEDRVVHHALIDVIGPTLDRALIDDTFACREGKGSLKAVLRAQAHARRWPWFVKVDVAKYFASLPHARLEAAVAKKIRDPGLFGLIGRIIAGHASAPGRGLPIGALTSQHFANFYLGPFDRALLGDSRVRGFVRYLDDSVWWTESKADARATLSVAEAFLSDALGLTPKHPSFVQRSDRGLGFLGFRVFPGTLKLSARRQRRYRAARQAWEQAYVVGAIDARTLQRGGEAALSIVAHADARGFLRAQRGANLDV